MFKVVPLFTSFFKGVSLCEEYKIDAESFIEQWMAFTLNNLNGSAPNLDNLDTFARKEFSKPAATLSNAPSKDNGQVGAGRSLAVYGTPVSVQYPFKAHAPRVLYLLLYFSKVLSNLVLIYLM